MTGVRCQGCNRPLRSARSLTLGMGRTCLAKARAKLLSEIEQDYKPAQRDKARAAIAGGGIRALSRPGLYAVDSSDGTTAYVTSATTRKCSCANGQHATRLGGCWHVCAARLDWAARVLGMRKAA